MGKTAFCWPGFFFYITGTERERETAHSTVSSLVVLQTRPRRRAGRSERHSLTVAFRPCGRNVGRSGRQRRLTDPSVLQTAFLFLTPRLIFPISFLVSSQFPLLSNMYHTSLSWYEAITSAILTIIIFNIVTIYITL